MPAHATLFTKAARRHVARLARVIEPAAAGLERRFLALLRKRRYGAVERRALMAMSPCAAARLGSIEKFLEQVDYNGRRLAKCNLSPDAAGAVLREFDRMLEPLLQGRFGPSLEQLQWATLLALERAYYRVREAESQALFAIYRAGAEGADSGELSRRLVRLLARAFHARAGGLLTKEGKLDRQLRRPLYIEQGSPEERWIVGPALRGRYASYWSYPLDESAAIQLGFSVPYPWLPLELELLEAAAEHFRKAAERAGLLEEVERLAAAARQAEDDERRRIGRELHDEAGQSLLSLRLQLEMMERGADPPMRARLREARGVLEGTVIELRRIIAALSPAVLERLGLARALHQLAGRFARTSPAGVRARLAGRLDDLPAPIQQVIYRVVQEALQNAAKHSQATLVKLSVMRTDKVIRTRISDNGLGFQVGATAAKPMSFGLAGMRERAALLGGTLAVRSACNQGTTVILELPLSSAEGIPHA
ncbi:MAG: sensor histidine kinase [Bryobacteraceae bacterium]|jgi:signal transduction histidine kinase